MKYSFILLTSLIALLITGCAKYPVESASGKADVAYLVFYSQEGRYADQQVNVSIDNQTSFKAQPIMMKRGNEKRKGTQYSVATGRRKLVVTNDKGEVIYNREIMLSTQDIKQILLQ